MIIPSDVLYMSPFGQSRKRKWRNEIWGMTRGRGETWERSPEGAAREAGAMRRQRIVVTSDSHVVKRDSAVLPPCWMWG